MKNLLIILIVLVAVGCGDTVNEAQKNKILESQIEKLIDVRVKKFNMTECQTDCHGERGKILIQSLDSNVLNLQIGHWMNCATSVKDDIAGFVYEDGVLNILIKPRPMDVSLGENGDTNYSYSLSVMCDCYFIMDFTLSHIEQIPDSILINNEPVNNYLGMFEGLIENGETIVN